MAKHKRQHRSSLLRERQYPYALPPARNRPSQPPPSSPTPPSTQPPPFTQPPPSGQPWPTPDAPTSRPVVPLEHLIVGQFYNCAIAFAPNTPGGKVPQQLPKHRVLLTGKALDQPAVHFFYLTAFGGGTPESFHGIHSLSKFMYLPVGETAASNNSALYMPIGSEPPRMKGWLKFSTPMFVCYSSDLPDREWLRHPLEWDEIIRAPSRVIGYCTVRATRWALDYTEAMHSGWRTSMERGATIDDWMRAAGAIQQRFLALKADETPTPIRSEEVPESQQIGFGEDEWTRFDDKEWTGIDDALLSQFDGADETDLDDVHLPAQKQLARTYLPLTPRHVGLYQSPPSPPSTIHREGSSPTPMGRLQDPLVLTLPPTIRGPRYGGQTTSITKGLGAGQQQDHEAARILQVHGAAAEPGEAPENEQPSADLYDPYTAIAVFWEIEVEDDDFNASDVTPTIERLTFGGRPRPVP